MIAALSIIALTGVVMAVVVSHRSIDPLDPLYNKKNVDQLVADCQTIPGYEVRWVNDAQYACIPQHPSSNAPHTAGAIPTPFVPRSAPRFRGLPTPWLLKHAGTPSKQ